MKFSLREARWEDVAAVSTIERTVFPCPWPERMFRRELENDFSIFKVLTRGGEVVGYYDLWICVEEAHLLNVAVIPSGRRRGYGTFMLKDALVEAERRGCRYVHLEVRPGNVAAITIYEKFGFEKVSRHPRYYNDGEDAEVMLKTLTW